MLSWNFVVAIMRCILAELSDRYITDRFLPDKAIDLIDEAASRIKMELDSKPEQMDKLDRRIIQLKMEKMHVAKESDDASKKRLELIDEEIDGLRLRRLRLFLYLCCGRGLTSLLLRSEERRVG